MSQPMKRRRMVRAVRLASSSERFMGWVVTLLTGVTGLTGGRGVVPRHGAVDEGLAAVELGGVDAVEVGVAGEGDGDVGGIAVPVLGVAVLVEGEGGALGGDLVGLAAEGTADEVGDLGGGVGCGWGGVHGNDETRMRNGEGSDSEAEVFPGDVEVIAEAGGFGDLGAVRGGGDEVVGVGGGLDGGDEGEDGVLDASDGASETEVMTHAVFIPEGFEELLGEGELGGVEGHGGRGCVVTRLT